MSVSIVPLVPPQQIVKILIISRSLKFALINDKEFLEATIQPSEYPTEPVSDEVKNDRASRQAAKRVLKDKLELKEIDENRLKYQPFNEEDKKRYVNIISYTLSDDEEKYIKSRKFPGFFIGFYPIGLFPSGLYGINGGIAYYVTRYYDVFRQRLFVPSPYIVYPTSVVTYVPIYSYPVFVPRPVIFSNYTGYNTILTKTYDVPVEKRGRERERSSRKRSSSNSSKRSRSPSRSSSRSSSRASSRASSRSPSKSSAKSSVRSSVKRMKRKERKFRKKYIKYKNKYLSLKDYYDL